MATATKRPAARAGNGKSTREAALERLNDSLDAAQKAAKAVRGDVTAGGRDLMRDVERMISQARKDVTKLERAVRADLSEFQKAVTRERRAGSGARKRPAAKRGRSAPRRKRPPAKSRA